MAKKVGSVYAEIRADIKKLQQDFDKAHDVTKKSAKRIQDTLDKGINFEKMAAGAVAAAASIYGAFRSVQQVIESARVGSVLDKQAKSFDNLSIAAGTSSKKMLDALKDSSQGLVAEADLMGAAGKALLMNIPADKITELMKIAAATSKMTGQSITEAFNDITMGVARQSRMILDNLGIIVNVDDANKNYAKALGKTADALTDTEKRQAFMNAVLKAGADMIDRIGSQGGQLDGVNKLIAAQTDLWNEVNKSVATFLDEELSGYAKALKGIADILKGMTAEKTSNNMSAMRKEIEMLRSLESKGMAQPGSTMRKMAEFNAKFGGGSEAEIANKGRYAEWQRPDQMADWRSREGNFAENTEAENKALIKKFEEEQKLRDENAKKELAWMDTYHKSVMSELEFEQATLDAKFKEYDKYVSNKMALDEWYAAEKKKLDVKMYAEGSTADEKRGFRPLSEITATSESYDVETQRVKSYQQSMNTMQKSHEDFEKNNIELWKNGITYGEDTLDEWVKLTERTADAMQQNFSDLFFDAMTGKLKTLEDYAKAVFDSIARMASDMAAQQLTQGLFGKDMQGGGWLSSLFNMVGGGGGTTGMGTNTTFAGGESMGGYMAMVKHGGGSYASGGATRSIPAAYFATAPRLHQGLAADEFPAVLQKGEQVIPKGGGKSQPIVHMHFYSQSGKYDRESVSQAQSGLYASLSRANRRNS